MLTSLVLIFVVVYTVIALEHTLGINKSATALIGAGLLWTLYALSDPGVVSAQLGESLMGTAQIVFLLTGAMTIVEVVAAHDGFDVITARIHTAHLSSLMWLVGCVTFFLSAILDNLTTTIVMVSLMKKLLDKHDDRLLFALIIGLVSAIVDNVPLVAASMDMYPLTPYPSDHFLWEFITYCAGTGGLILVIGSAFNVAAMGLEKIQFFWYVKRISALALVATWRAQPLTSSSTT